MPSKPTSSCATSRRASFRASSVEVVCRKRRGAGRANAGARQHRRDPRRFRREIESAAYFVVAEALTNLAKHSRARTAAVAGWLEDNQLRVDVTDDGVGGAQPEGGGLRGLADRVDALGGRLGSIVLGGGTRIIATLPLEQ